MSEQERYEAALAASEVINRPEMDILEAAILIESAIKASQMSDFTEAQIMDKDSVFIKQKAKDLQEAGTDVELARALHKFGKLNPDQRRFSIAYIRTAKPDPNP